MLNIFFISNDIRVERLIEHFQPFFKSKIRMASDFDQGLKEVFENRPNVVFIESFIGAVSGETVARHIKSLLGADSPRIVFMSKEEQKGKSGASWCDDWILYGDSDESLRGNFINLISKRYPDDWLEISSEISRSAVASREAPPERSHAGNRGEPEGSGEWDIPDFVIPVEPEQAIEKPSPVTASQEAASRGGPDSLPEESVASVEESPEYKSLGIETLQAEGRLSRKTLAARRSRVWAMLVIAGMLAGAGIWFHYSQEGKRTEGKTPARPVPGSEAPAGQTAPRENAGRGVTALPSFIKPEWRDPSYSSANPGWDRYVSPAYEFRVFRENDVIRALQVVSVSKQGITDAFLVALLRDMGHAGSLPEGMIEKKDGFLVKRYVISGFAEIVSYREEGAERAKALVVELLP